MILKLLKIITKNYTKNNLNLEQLKYLEINTKFKNILTDKKQLESDNLFITMYQNNEYNISQEYKTSYNELKEMFVKKENLQHEIDSLVESKEGLLKYESDITKLISLGNDLIKDIDTGICPLCNHDHEEHVELLERISSNSANSIGINIINNDIETLEDHYTQIQEDFTQKEDILKVLLKNKLSKFKVLYSSINEDQTNKKNEIDSIENELLLIDDNLKNFIRQLKSIYNI